MPMPTKRWREESLLTTLLKRGVQPKIHWTKSWWWKSQYFLQTGCQNCHLPSIQVPTILRKGLGQEGLLRIVSTEGKRLAKRRPRVEPKMLREANRCFMLTPWEEGIVLPDLPRVRARAHVLETRPQKVPILKPKRKHCANPPQQLRPRHQRHLCDQHCRRARGH